MQIENWLQKWFAKRLLNFFEEQNVINLDQVGFGTVEHINK